MIDKLISRLVISLYLLLPKSVVAFLGSSRSLKTVRDLILRKNGYARTVISHVQWLPDTSFKFMSNARVASKVRVKPVEGRLLRCSIDLLKKFRQSDSSNVIIDIGASYGYLSLVWAHTVAKQGQVYSFEVNPHVFECLNYNVQSNHCKNRISVINQPVFSSSIPIPISDGPSASNLKEGKSDFHNLRQAVSVDDFVKANQINRVDLIKIDVDGPDYEVLIGAERVLHEFKPIVIIEFTGDQRIPEWLKLQGYNLFDLGMQPFATQQGINLVCIPETIRVI